MADKKRARGWKEKKAVKGGAVNYSALLQAGLNVMGFFCF